MGNKDTLENNKKGIKYPDLKNYDTRQSDNKDFLRALWDKAYDAYITKKL